MRKMTKKHKALKYSILLFLFLLTIYFIKFYFFNPREIIFHDAIIYGKIKSIKEISYEARLEKGIVKKGKRWRRGHLENDFHCFFDKKGKLTKTIFYRAVDSGKTSYFVKYYYANNQLINFYTHYDLNDKYGFKYDFYLERDFILKDNETTKYKYGRNKKIKKKISYNFSSKNLEFRNIYKYENNFLKYNILYYFGAKWYLIEEYVRDNSGNIIKERLGSSFQDLKKTNWREYVYTFDKQRNWISCIYYRYKKPAYIIERKIEYY